MKKILFIFLISSFFSIAQTSSPVIKISKIKLQPNSDLNSVKDIVSDLNTCKIDSFKVTFSIRGSIKEFRIRTEFFTPEIRQIISSFNAGQKFFIEDVKSDCVGKKAFIIKVI